MQNQITISPANPRQREAIINLLQSERLPVEDLAQDLSNFLVATDNRFVIGIIGLEIYERQGLLRSLAVKPEYRKMGIATTLVNGLENLSRSLGLNNMYLLTETAKDYFVGKGYLVIERAAAPAALKQSTEFSHLCPSTATLLHKRL